MKEFKKYSLEKKWWETNFDIYEADGTFICRSEKHGIFNPRIEMHNADHEPFLLLKHTNWSQTAYNILRGEEILAHIKLHMLSNRFTLHIGGNTEILIKLSDWKRKILFLKDGEEVALASGSSTFSKMGVAIREDIDPQYILSSLVLISFMKNSGYC